MQNYIYRVDPRMIPPIIMSMLFGIFLIILEGATQRGFLSFALLVPFYYLGAEILARKIIISEHGITVQKFLRSAHMDWSEIEMLDMVQTGRKVFLILQGGQNRPLLITNTIYRFESLLQKIMEKLPKQRISEPVKDLRRERPSKYGPMIQAWIVCLVLLGIVVGKLLGYG
jgi:hypothetical protein